MLPRRGQTISTRSSGGTSTRAWLAANLGEPSRAQRPYRVYFRLSIGWFERKSSNAYRRSARLYQRRSEFHRTPFASGIERRAERTLAVLRRYAWARNFYDCASQINSSTGARKNSASLRGCALLMERRPFRISVAAPLLPRTGHMSTH
ncbi:MAG: hypothetical protein ABSF98_19200 [Bryobacteraceae bacterium]